MIMTLSGRTGSFHVSPLSFFLVVSILSFVVAWILNFLWSKVRKPVLSKKTLTENIFSKKVLSKKTPSKDYRAWIEIDLAALKHNARVLQELLPKQCKLMAVVKANAYGHGDITIAKTLNQLDIYAFAVATLEEGIHLRKNGIKGEILILGYTNPCDIDCLVHYRLTQNEPIKTAQSKTAQPKTIQRETTQSAVVQREAEQSETEQSETAKPEIAQPEEDSYEIYVDGSYINNNVGYGVVILKNGELLKEISGCVTDPVFTGSRQVGGEITAVMEALAWSKREKISKVTIFYDLENLKKWATGEYSANIPMSKAYRDFIQSSGVSVQWNKVAAHSGVKWNERADELAKKGTAESVKNNKEAPDLIKELEETAERFALYLEDNGYIAEFLRIYNKMSAKICIEKDGELLGYIDIYNTKKLHLQPRYHEIKEDEVMEEMERLWETFRKSEKI
jgi:ribonuclease HI